MRFHQLEEAILSWHERSLIGGDNGLTQLQSSQKFYFGDASLVPLRDQLETFPRLPYGRCAFEFEFLTLDRSKFGLGAIVICEEIGKQVNAFVWSKDAGDFWYPAGVIRIDRELNLRQRYCDEVAWSRAVTRGGKAKALEGVKLELTFADSVVGLLGHALNVMNCVNITTQTIEAPVALNKKRAKVGKPPLYEYKVLVLAQGKTRIFPQGGTHDSPRIHLRRGHLKHRKTGTFWWQPHAVGDKKRGVVVKDYQAAPLMQAAHR